MHESADVLHPLDGHRSNPSTSAVCSAVFAQVTADSGALGVDWGNEFPSDGKTQMIVGLTGLGLRFNNVANGAHLGAEIGVHDPAGMASDERVSGRDRR